MILRALAVLAALASTAAVAPGSSEGSSMDSVGSVASKGGQPAITNEGVGNVATEQGASSSELGSPTPADVSTSAAATSEASPGMIIGESLLLGQPAEEAVKIRNNRKGSGDEFKLEAAGSTVLGHIEQGDGVSMGLATEQLVSPFLEHPEQPKSLDRMVGARQSWWGLSCIVSVAIFALGLALCNGLGHKIDKEELLESGQEMYSGKAFVPGALVSVTKAFMSNGEPPVQLRQGQTGVIQKIDAVGDALIRFADHSASQWVYEQNYQNLRVR